MRIAVYQGFDYIHYEMLGYILDYFKHINSKYNINTLKFNIYAKLITTGIDWLIYYNKHLNMNISWNEPNLFNPNNYEYIILLTDDDMSFKDEWLIKYNYKIITINHWQKNRRIETPYNIGTRFFVTNPYQEYILPSYMGIPYNQKKKILLNNKINVSCIGAQNIPPSTLFLKDLFTNFNEINFHIVARHIPYNYNSSNINTYIFPSCNDMFNIINKSDYILCIEIPNTDTKSNCISGAIPLSFSYGCQLLIPKIWQDYYNFKSSISYLDNHVQNNGNSKLTLSKNINLDNIYNELYEIINHRNNIFDNIFINKFYIN